LIGFAGLNATPAPGLPSLPGNFGPMNGLALQQQAQGSGFQPAYAPPSDISTPDAGSSLAVLMSQMGPNVRVQPRGVMPNSSTPPAAADGASPGANSAAPAAAAPITSFQDMVHAYAQLKAGASPLGSLGQIGQNIAGNIGNSPLGQLFAHLTGGGQPQGVPSLGDMSQYAPTPLPMQPNAGVLGSVNPGFANSPSGILGFGG
jgi:hypothetical protein